MGDADSSSERLGDRNGDDHVLLSVDAYSAHAREYAETYSTKKLDLPRRFAASLPTHSLILDAGCGPGRDLRLFAEQGHIPIGVELNPEFVAMANVHAPTLRADLREIATHFPTATFDGVWAQASLVHLSEIEAADVLRQLNLLLRPGGQFFTCVSSRGETGWLDEPDGRRWYNVWDPQHFADMVAAAGFTVHDVHPGAYVEVWAVHS